jgi:hypothetical protein
MRGIVIYISLDGLSHFIYDTFIILHLLLMCSAIREDVM